MDDIEVSKFLYEWVRKHLTEGPVTTAQDEDGATLLVSAVNPVALRCEMVLEPGIPYVPTKAVDGPPRLLRVRVINKRDLVRGEWSYKVRFPQGTEMYLAQSDIINSPDSRNIERGW